MKFFTSRQWREHLLEVRQALAAGNNTLADYEREELARYRAVIAGLWESHSKPYPDGQPGDSRFGQEWWCSGCRTQWPCSIARAVFRAKGMTYEYLPLRMPIRGEKRLKDGLQLGAGHWMRVQGVEPDQCPKCDDTEAQS